MYRQYFSPLLIFGLIYLLITPAISISNESPVGEVDTNSENFAKEHNLGGTTDKETVTQKKIKQITIRVSQFMTLIGIGTPLLCQEMYTKPYTTFYRLGGWAYVANAMIFLYSSIMESQRIKEEEKKQSEIKKSDNPQIDGWNLRKENYEKELKHKEKKNKMLQIAMFIQLGAVLGSLFEYGVHEGWFVPIGIKKTMLYCSSPDGVVKKAFQAITKAISTFSVLKGLLNSTTFDNKQYQNIKFDENNLKENELKRFFSSLILSSAFAGAEKVSFFEKKIADFKQFISEPLNRIIVHGGIAAVITTGHIFSKQNIKAEREAYSNWIKNDYDPAITALSAASNSFAAQKTPTPTNKDENDKFQFDFKDSEYLPSSGYCYSVVEGILTEDQSCNCKTKNTCLTIPDPPDKNDKFQKSLQESVNNLAKNEKAKNPFYGKDIDKMIESSRAKIDALLDSSQMKTSLNSTGLTPDKIRSAWDNYAKDLPDGLSAKTIAMKSSDQSQSSSSRNSFKDDTPNFPNFNDKNDKPSAGGIFINADSGENLDTYNNDIRSSDISLFDSISGRYQSYRTTLEKQKAPTKSNANPNKNYNSR